MPIPLIIGGIALASGIFGAKKGLDAKKNYSKARSVVEEATSDFEGATEVLEKRKAATNDALTSLGRCRVSVEANQMKRFVATAKRINNASYKSIAAGLSRVNLSAPDLKDIELSSYRAADLLKDGISGLSSGVLAGIGAGSLATSLGVASTGTAISSLAGVAASNATLAWLGGGSLAAGGMGVAGGTAVLGGAIAGPVIAVMGYSAAAKSERALTEAYQHESDIRIAIEQVENGCVLLEQIAKRTGELEAVIAALSERLDTSIQSMGVLIGGKEEEMRRLAAEARAKRGFFARLFRVKPALEDLLDFNGFSDREKAAYSTMTLLGYTVYGLLKVTIIDEQGGLSDDSERAIADARQVAQGAGA